MNDTNQLEINHMHHDIRLAVESVEYELHLYKYELSNNIIKPDERVADVIEEINSLKNSNKRACLNKSCALLIQNNLHPDDLKSILELTKEVQNNCSIGSAKDLYNIDRLPAGQLLEKYRYRDMENNRLFDIGKELLYSIEKKDRYMAAEILGGCLGGGLKATNEENRNDEVKLLKKIAEDNPKLVAATLLQKVKSDSKEISGLANELITRFGVDMIYDEKPNTELKEALFKPKSVVDKLKDIFGIK